MPRRAKRTDSAESWNSLSFKLAKFFHQCLNRQALIWEGTSHEGVSNYFLWDRIPTLVMLKMLLRNIKLGLWTPKNAKNSLTFYKDSSIDSSLLREEYSTEKWMILSFRRNPCSAKPANKFLILTYLGRFNSIFSKTNGLNDSIKCSISRLLPLENNGKK